MSADNKGDKLPRHIAIIPDGNRRWAKQRGLPAWEGHRAGKKVFEKLTDWCKEAGVKELSFWAASTENLERDKAEVNFLLKLFDEICDKFIKEHHDKKIKDQVRIRFVGDLNRLPVKLREKMKKVMELTKDNSDYKLNMLVGYGGRWEISCAAQKIAEKVRQGKLKPQDITPEVFHQHLELDSEPDLIIRTSEQRLSGLLPWQSIYSEIIFVKDKHWPEFTKEDFKRCLEEYAQRQRRFGH
jgi:undecaprenyl diphosphate synthase